MLKTHDYNIHNILKMRIRREKKIPDLFRDLNLRFSYFEVEKVNNPSLIINIGKFTPAKTDSFFVDHSFHIGDGYFYCKDTGGKAHWELEILGIEDEITTLNFNGSILGLHEIFYPHILAQSLIGRFLLQYKLSQKGYFMIHGGSVVKDDKAVVFAGRGGANKSSLVMDLVRNRGFTFQADDWTLFRGDTVYSFPIHFQEFNFRVETLPSEHLRSLTDGFRLLSFLNKSFDYRNSKVKVQKSCTLRLLNILVKTNKNKLNIIKNADKHLIKRMLYQNNQLEETLTGLSRGLLLKGTLRYTLGYSFIHPQNGFQEYWGDFDKALDRLIEKVPCHILEIPRHYNKSVAENIYSLLQEHL